MLVLAQLIGSSNFKKLVEIQFKYVCEKIIPLSFNNLIYACVISSEVHEAFQTVSGFCANVVLVKDFACRKGLRAEEIDCCDCELSEREQEALLSAILKKTDTEMLSELLRETYGYVPGKTVENFVGCIQSLSRGEPFRLEYPDGVGLPIVPINYKVSQVAYKQRSVFVYEDQFPELLELMLARREVLSAFQERGQRALDECLSSPDEIVRIEAVFFKEVLLERKIQLAEAQNWPDVRLLASVITGQDFSGNKALATPQQLLFVISRLETENIVFPDSAAPVMLGGQLFYVLDFSSALRGYECLQDVKNTTDVFHDLKVAIDAFAGYYNDVSIRSYYLTSLTAANVFVQTDGDDENDQKPKIVFPGVPTAFNPPQRHKFFIYTNMCLEYSLQYLFLDIASQATEIQELQA